MPFFEQTLTQVGQSAIDQVLGPLHHPAEQSRGLRDGVLLEVQHHRESAFSFDRRQTRAYGRAKLLQPRIALGVADSDRLANAAGLTRRAAELQGLFSTTPPTPNLVDKSTVCHLVEIRRRKLGIPLTGFARSHHFRDGHLCNVLDIGAQPCGALPSHCAHHCRAQCGPALLGENGHAVIVHGRPSERRHRCNAAESSSHGGDYGAKEKHVKHLRHIAAPARRAIREISGGEGERAFIRYLRDGREDGRLDTSSIAKERFEMTRTALVTATLITAIAWSAALPAAPAQSDQITHRPLNGTSLAPAVVVRGFVPGRQAGVSSDFDPARHWSANIRVVPTSVDFGTTVIVRGGTETGSIKTLSSLVIRERRLASAVAADEEDPFALTFTPKLLSPTYRLEIWNGGTRVFDVGGLKSGSGVLAGNDAICDALGKANSIAMGVCYATVGTCSTLDDHGRFNWTIRRVAPVRWVVPAVSPDPIIGDQLRIIEETASSTGRSYLKNVNVQGLNLSEMALMDEMATATVPDGHLPGR